MSDFSNRPEEEYPAADWPYTFYFNGVQMPRWSAQWHLCGLQTLLNDYVDDWDEFIGYKHLRLLKIWLDLIGVIRSEDPLIFRVCTQEMLMLLLGRPNEVLEQIQASAPSGHSPPEILAGLTEGAAKMITLCQSEGRAIWINGYPAEQNFLLESLPRMMSAQPPLPSMELPHIICRRKELTRRASWQHKDLRRLAQSGNLNKRHRQIVLQLPDVPSS